jgi:hypothetical protein
MNKIKPGLIILMTLTSLNVFGQFEIGLKGGLNISNVRNKDISYYERVSPIPGFHIGLFTQVDFTDKFHLNSEVLISSRGFRLVVFAQRKETIYLEIPVLLTYSLIEKVEIEFGPDLGVMISNNSENIDDNFFSYESLDVGLATGLRYKLNDKVYFTGRYYHGLTSIGELFSQNSKSFNRVVQFSVGHKIK